MKHLKLMLIALLAVGMLSCSDDDDNPAVKSSEKKILEFSGHGVKAVIDEAAKTINLSLSENMQLGYDVIPDIVISDKASVSPASGVSVNLAKPVTYTVTAEDGSTQAYTVTMNMLSAANKITKFSVNGVEVPIDGMFEKGEIALILPYGTDITKLAPQIELEKGATVQPASGVVTDFTNPVTYTVTSEDGQFKREYNVKLIALAFDFKVTSLSTLKARPKQFVYVDGVFNETRTGMLVYLRKGDALHECVINSATYSPERMRVTIPDEIEEGLYDLVVRYSHSSVERTYPEKFEITHTIPTVQGTSSLEVKNSDKLFVYGLNLKSAKGTKALVRFVPEDENATVKAFDLQGDVVNFGGRDIIYLDNLSSLPAQSYRFYVYIDGVQSEVSTLCRVNNEQARAVISSISNTNPSVGQTISITGKGFGNNSPIDIYVKGINGTDIYYPIHRIAVEDITYTTENSNVVASFKVPKLDNVSRFKLTIRYVGIASELSSQEVVLK